RISRHAHHSFCDHEWIPGSKKQAGVTHELTHRAGFTRNHRDAVPHRLQEWKAEALVLREAKEQVGGPVMRRQLGLAHGPGEDDAALEAQTSHGPVKHSQVGVRSRAAYDEQPDL